MAGAVALAITVYLAAIERKGLGGPRRPTRRSGFPHGEPHCPQTPEQVIEAPRFDSSFWTGAGSQPVPAAGDGCSRGGGGVWGVVGGWGGGGGGGGGGWWGGGGGWGGASNGTPYIFTTCSPAVYQAFPLRFLLYSRTSAKNRWGAYASTVILKILGVPQLLSTFFRRIVGPGVG